MKRAAVWEIEYLPVGEDFRNCIQIILFFENEEPFIVNCDFQLKGRLDYIDEDEFMNSLEQLFNII